MTTAETEALEVLATAIQKLVRYIEERHREAEVLDGKIKTQQESLNATRDEEKRQVMLGLKDQLTLREELVNKIKKDRAQYQDSLRNSER